MKYTLYLTTFNLTTYTLTKIPVAGFMDKRAANRAKRAAEKENPSGEYTIEENKYRA